MRKILLILSREYLVRVRTKAFVVFTVLMPLLIGSIFVLPTRLMLRGSGTRHIVVVAADSALAHAVQAELVSSHSPDDIDGSESELRHRSFQPEFDVTVDTLPTEELRQSLTAQVRDGRIDGFIWIDADAAATRKATYYSRNGGDFVEVSLVSRALRIALSQRQLADHGFSPDQAKALLGPVHIDAEHIDKQGANSANGIGSFLLPYALLMAIYVTVLIYGVYVMRSVIEEKSSRVVEVLLGSVTPMQLMAGKIIGVGAVGLTQIAIWASTAAVLGTGSFSVIRQFIGENMKDAHVSTAAVVFFPVCFLLGYATYACLYAAIGAMCNSDEEAGQLQFPVTLPLVLCIICAMGIIRDPNTPLAFWLSIFPLTSPIIMFVRVSVSMPPNWQIALFLVVSIASLYALTWLTSRIFRVGILMYGKRPNLPEILKWIRHA